MTKMIIFLTTHSVKGTLLVNFRIFQERGHLEEPTKQTSLLNVYGWLPLIQLPHSTLLGPRYLQ